MSLDAYLADNPTPAPVAVVVLVHEAPDLPGALEAVEGQVYEPGARFVVGGDAGNRSVAEENGYVWKSSLAEVLAAFSHDMVYVWLLHDRARPRPDVRRTLVEESTRVDASVAGSKLLSRTDPTILESIGILTDVFDVPTSGLDPLERDQQQYEVVRDAAAVSGASVLIRRDLLAGLGGPDPKMAPESAAIDLCQRARLRGARVVIVPSSEVLYPHRPARRTAPWREEAGRIRAAAKVYSVMTLAWVLPVGFFTSLLEALVAPLLGRWTLFNLLRAWLWNLVLLPSTISARWKARRGRVVGDAELFRYQVRGSARLRSVSDEVADRIAERFPQGGGGFAGLVEAGQDTVRSPGFIAAAVALLFVVLATRSIWSGTLPSVGFTLPPSESALDTLRAYGGGWNIAGLGSPEPLHPSIAAVALAQLLLFDRPELTAAVLTVLALVAGVVGSARLLRHWGIKAPVAYVGGVVVVAGPAAQALAGRTEWTALLALGVLPWVLRVALRPWPRRLRGRVGRIAALAWLTGLTAALLPGLIVVPVAALVVWALLGRGQRWWAVGRAAVGTALAVPLLLPWFEVVSLSSYVESGTLTYWEIWLPAAIAVAAAGIAVLLAADRGLAAIGGWGLVLAAGGVALGRLGGTLDAGRDAAATGMAIASLGVGVVTAAAFELVSRIERVAAWRRILTAAGVLAAVGIVASTAWFAGPGRAGLPGDAYRRALAFTVAQSADPTASRILIAGPADDLPGESRSLDGAAYRVVSAPVPRLWEARLAEPRLGDRELERTLRAVTSGETARAGEALAPFGIRWVVVLGDSPFLTVFEGQLDLVPLPGLASTVFLNEAEAVRAIADDGTTWQWDPPAYRGPATADGVVFIAENADQRWGTDGWEQEGWANGVTASAGVIEFDDHQPYRREAQLAGALFFVFLIVSLIGTGRKAQ